MAFSVKSSLLIVFAGILTNTTVSLADCSRDEAMNKMMVLNQHGTKIQGKPGLDPTITDAETYNANFERFKAYSTRLASGGPLIAAGKFAEACKVYDELAKENGVSFSKSDVLKVDQVQQKQGTGCDMVDASKKMVGITQSFATAYAAGKITAAQSHQFSIDSNPIQVMISSNPGEACKQMDKLQGKYGL